MFSTAVILKMTTLPLRPASISCAFRTNAQLLAIMLPFTRSWELRGLEDTEEAGDEDVNNNDDSSDGKLMSIEHELESALVEMFYNAPSEWTGRHWALVAGMVAIVSILLCWFCLCVINCFCGSKGESKPMLLRTDAEQNNQYDLMKDEQNKKQYTKDLTKDEQKNQYTNNLCIMIDNTATEGDVTDDENSFGRLENPEYETSTSFSATDSNFDSASTDEESFQNEDISPISHGDYRYTGRNRRQLT
jgi:hypothetical protein